MKDHKIIRPWPRLLNFDEAADYLGISRKVVEEWYAEGRLSAHELPGIRGRAKLEKIVFERSQIDRFVGLRPE